MGRYASAPNLPGLLPSDSSSLEGQQPADLPAGETRHCLSAKPHMHTAVRGPPATVSACGRTIRSQIGIALSDSMHSAAVLPCIRGCKWPAACPGMPPAPGRHMPTLLTQAAANLGACCHCCRGQTATPLGQPCASMCH